MAKLVWNAEVSSTLTKAELNKLAHEVQRTILFMIRQHESVKEIDRVRVEEKWEA